MTACHRPGPATANCLISTTVALNLARAPKVAEDSNSLWSGHQQASSRGSPSAACGWMGWADVHIFYELIPRYW